jgi:hypothetical protein
MLMTVPLGQMVDTIKEVTLVKERLNIFTTPFKEGILCGISPSDIIIQVLKKYEKLTAAKT